MRELLPTPTGHELQIILTNELHIDETQTLVFTQKEVSIGRSSTSDISLPLQSISRQHARIFEQDEAFYIEDMQSVSGTFVNKRKLDAAHPCLLNAGDEIRMYPYVLRVAHKSMWTRDEAIGVIAFSPPAYLGAEEFISSFKSDTCLFEARLFSNAGDVVLAINRSLVQAILSRMLRGGGDAGAVDADATLLEFVAACVLERLNRKLQFPFEFSLRPLSRQTSENEFGLMLEAVVRLGGEHGYMRMFLPGSVLEKMATVRNELPPFTKKLLSWQLSLCIGAVVLDADEILQVEPGDTLVYFPEYSLLLPSDPKSATQRGGWRLAKGESAPSDFVVQNFHEWGFEMPQEDSQDQDAAVSAADLSTLPITIHVVLTRVDMNLQELETLAAGSIIQLDEETNSTVQLVSGGKVLGAGELVNLDDGRMGVKIANWRER
ncbi:FHA domain-containing protein [Silvibacterium bohemicum]|uniref:FHA domain-containing protein n=1 Tax=Silvibacterium bohemicum TaxID=1577686 RepID=UPI001614F73F|nr:FHA domain-containing protein [Silvibacterium bohemicum]